MTLLKQRMIIFFEGDIILANSLSVNGAKTSEESYKIQH